MYFKVGGRDDATFLRLLDRLSDAERFETDAYGAYGALPANKHVIGKCRAVNWNDGQRSGIAREVEQACSSDKGMRKERGDAGESTCAGPLRQAQTQRHSTFRIPGGISPGMQRP